jgi:hypothetical protein
MNKKLLIGVGALIIIGGAIGFMMMNRSNQTTYDIGMPHAISLKSLMASSKPQKCTVTTATGDSQSSGTVYILNGKMRGDFMSVTNGKTITSHMITMDNTSYVWTDEMAQGFKMSMDEMQKQPSSQTSQTVDINQESPYSCTSWTSDSSTFALPAGITFTSMADMMGAGIQGNLQINGNTNDSQCGACDGAPEPQRTQCRTSLNCK